jgi:hypothetical protein
MNEEYRKGLHLQSQEDRRIGSRGSYRSCHVESIDMGISYGESDIIATWRSRGVSERFMLLNQESQPARGMIVAIDIVLGCRLL